MKEFIIESPEKIPPKSKENVNQKLETSDLYFGLLETSEGNIRKCVCYWDFVFKKWFMIGGTGIKKLIEYYIEK